MQYKALALSLLPSLAASTCYDGVNIIQARGTGEAREGSLQDVAANATIAAIPGSFLSKVPYPANTSLPESSNEGTEEMSAMANDYAKECPNSKIVLMGYSQGALVLGNVLTGGVGGVPPLSQEVHDKVVGVILYGDPERQKSEPYDRDTCVNDGPAPRSGDYSTLFNSYSDVMLSYCAMEDPVCCKNGTNISAHVSYFTGENAQEVASFLKGNFEKAAAHYV